jgi:O-antigen biosynthesis protein
MNNWNPEPRTLNPSAHGQLTLPPPPNRIVLIAPRENGGTAESRVYSIVILTHNKSAYTRACLDSIVKAGCRKVEVIVVDNGSTDDTPALFAEFDRRLSADGGKLSAILNQRNVGCSTARNMGIAAASGEYIVFLDNDTVIPAAGWLEQMSDVLRREPKARIVGPKICYPAPPHDIQCAGVGISRTGRAQFRGRGEPQGDPRFAKAEPVQALISACMMFDARLAAEIGGLDEAFNPIEYEDFDFCYRARERGYEVIYSPEPVIYHWESITSEGTHTLPNRYLIIKHGMLFKKRWRHMFERENGPADSETNWKKITMPSLHGKRTR